MDKVKVAILGGSGYTAVELIKILLRHPGAEIAAVTSRQAEHIADLHPSLLGRLDLQCEPFDPDALKAKGVQVAFGCLPHGTSMESIPPLLERGIRVIDLSADYRLRDANVYARVVQGDAPRRREPRARGVRAAGVVRRRASPARSWSRTPAATRRRRSSASRRSSPNKLIELTGIIIDSKSGVSGAGRTPKLNVHFPECNESVSAYAVGTHRHTPEIEQALSDIAGEAVSVIFTPHLMPMDRGIFSTIYATPTRSRQRGGTGGTVSRATSRTSRSCACAPTPPATKDTTDTNFLDVCVKVVRGKVIVLAAEDNLIRGASGVAVQNFNRMFGFDERTGLL